MAILADSREEEIDPAGRLDLVLVRVALADQVPIVTVEDVYVRRINVDCAPPAASAHHAAAGWAQAYCARKTRGTCAADRSVSAALRHTGAGAYMNVWYCDNE